MKGQTECKKAFLLLKSDISDRIKDLVNKEEYGYAILNLWNQIEAGLKLSRCIEKGAYPENLNIRWTGFLKMLSEEMPEILKVIFSKEQNCLWKIRNGIVHANQTITKEQYEQFYEKGKLLLNKLKEHPLLKQDSWKGCVKTKKKMKNKK